MTNISILQTDTLIDVMLKRRRGVKSEFLNNVFVSSDNHNHINNFWVSTETHPSVACFHIRVQRRHVLANYAASASFNDMIFLPSGHRLVSQTCLVLIMSLLQWEGNRQYNICLSIKALKYQAIQYNTYTKHSLNISDIVEGKRSVSIYLYIGLESNLKKIGGSK